MRLSAVLLLLLALVVAVLVYTAAAPGNYVAVGLVFGMVAFVVSRWRALESK